MACARARLARFLGDAATVDLGKLFNGFNGVDSLVEGSDDEVEPSCLFEGLLKGFLFFGLSSFGLFNFQSDETSFEDDDDIGKTWAWVRSEEGFSFEWVSSDDGAGVHPPGEHLVLGLEGKPGEDFLLDLGFLHAACR